MYATPYFTGVGLKVLNTIEKAAIAIDNDIKALIGPQITEIHELMENLKLVSSEILEKKRETGTT